MAESTSYEGRAFYAGCVGASLAGIFTAAATTDPGINLVIATWCFALALPFCGTVLLLFLFDDDLTKRMLRGRYGALIYAPPPLLVIVGVGFTVAATSRGAGWAFGAVVVLLAFALWGAEGGRGDGR